MDTVAAVESGHVEGVAPKYVYLVKSPGKRCFGYRDPHPDPRPADGMGAAAVPGDVAGRLLDSLHQLPFGYNT